MGIFKLIGVVLKMFVLMWQTKQEKDKIIKKKKEEILKGVRDGIKKRDASAINSGFDSIRNL